MSKKERAARTREALIHSAASVFGQRGYVETTLGMISSGAGVSAGALHFHFENKASLAAAVEASAADSLRATVRAVYAARGSALHALTESSHALARTLADDAVARAGVRLGHEAVYVTARNLPEQWYAYVRRLLAEAAQEGALLPGLCLRHAAAMVVAATIGFEVLARDDPKWLSARTLNGFWRVVLPALGTPEALRRLALRGPGP
ncbi:ScbR family autoregulator-binding transcription factor [Streptomyces sp. NPDC058279]|uniref:ScbR family autoregulator-binding transcription factor n=1 Tax=Streptomyces sp. NPDC058279 TaxID=3346418 RepID=UPI0036E5BE3F